MEYLFQKLLLPHWAERYANGEYLQVGAQLATKDGRYTGNGVVTGIKFVENVGKRDVTVVTVITDMGNSVQFSPEQLLNQFHPPEFIMKHEEVLSKYVNVAIS